MNLKNISINLGSKDYPDEAKRIVEELEDLELPGYIISRFQDFSRNNTAYKDEQKTLYEKIKKTTEEIFLWETVKSGSNRLKRGGSWNNNIGFRVAA
ncbi:unnamed protein product [marine sediment metagenome]|uniref:Uncharacterized protein n=1 Tax=marine sediment metagenome TaxID=412755 RepID=X1A1M6_9ZZZZ